MVPGSPRLLLLAGQLVRERDAFFLWYSGSTGTVAHRISHLGLARSADGTSLPRQEANPVLRLLDGKRSILTPLAGRQAFDPDADCAARRGRHLFR